MLATLALALVAATDPLVVHVTVALCDNEAQGIVPVPAALGDGQDPARNLYWGARYGVRTHLPAAGWRRVPHEGVPPDGVLERAVFARRVGKREVVLVADAWDGRRIGQAIARYLAHAAGHLREPVRVGGRDVDAGGAAALTAYVGHDGLMELEAPEIPPPPAGAPPRATMALACVTARYFGAPLARTGAEVVLTTYGLMAPEAYVLDAAIVAWIEGRDARGAAAEAYARYQRCGARAARRLFGAR